jgi:hypothetical protein
LARDNFSKTVIDRLKSRVAHRCSNPDCRTPTSAPSEKDGVNSIGVAAHISAASPGGPRYDHSMTADERKSIDNAIWLCANCSIDIDKDATRYPTPILHEWKRKAEDIARAELGTKLPSNNETIDTLSTALTGLPKSYISTAISNVHRATEKSLESLDSRFFVKTSHENNRTTISIHAKENVQLTFIINNKNAKKHMDQCQGLFKHGNDLVINSDDISIKGSKVLEQIFETAKGTFSFAPNKVEATQKLWLVQKETNITEPFDDIQGFISYGIKSFTYRGTACNEMFSFGFHKSLDENDEQISFTMSLYYDKWEGVSVNSLPYFEKLFSIFNKMHEGWELFTSLEIEGARFFLSKGHDASKSDYINNMAGFFNYIECSRITASTLKLDISYTSNISYTSEEYEKICDVADILKGNQIYEKEMFTNNANCKITTNEKCSNVSTLKNTKQPCDIKIVSNEREEITVFGQKFTLPTKTFILTSVLALIHEEIESLQEGDIVEVEWLPQENFTFKIGYES